MKWPKNLNLKDFFNSKNAGLFILLIFFLFGILFITLFGSKYSGWDNIITAISIGVLTAGGSFLTGGMIGFLFGIPRTHQNDQYTIQSEKGVINGSVDYLVNTNLEQISDWLTKILVGVGLTQLGDIRSGLIEFSAYIGTSIDGTQNNNALITTIIIYFHICGFLASYIATRIHLAKAFREAESMSEIRKDVAELKHQQQLDARALRLVRLQLDAPPGNDRVDPKELEESIKKASAATKVTIFNQAESVRRENWKDPAKKEVMERVIPIFRALIISDTGCQFHTNYGQLGFALKDQRNPAWKDALEALNKAIEIRGSAKIEGRQLYEFNRAKCQIMSDKNFQAGRETEDTLKAKIMDDLRVAYQNKVLVNIIQSDKDLNKWLELNNINEFIS